MPGYNNLEVSSEGRVRRPFPDPRKKTPFLAQQKTRNGYMRVGVYNGKSVKTLLVHRLVASAFVDGFEPGLCVNHINSKKDDNRAINLEWVTQQQNVRHSQENGRRHKIQVEAGDDTGGHIIKQVPDEAGRVLAQCKICGSERIYYVYSLIKRARKGCEQCTKGRHSQCLLSYQGKTQNLTAWARDLGLSHATLVRRLKVSDDLSYVLHPGKHPTHRQPS